MKILVLGATGMLGHKLLQVAADSHEVVGTVRDDPARWREHPVLGGRKLVGGVRADDHDTVAKAIADERPDVVINCIGIIKQLKDAQDPLRAIGINALWPHRLAVLTRAAGARLVHFSTDCVFSGKKGNYRETDVSDAEDLYGRTKFLGEVAAPGCLTLRTSIIGRELGSQSGLVEWFLSQRGKSVKGFAKAIYSGLTTHVLARLIVRLVEHQQLEGVWQVASSPISKYDLLSIVNDRMNVGCTIQRDETFVCDRSLDGSRFREETGWEAPSWTAMLGELAADPTPYDVTRSTSAHGERHR
jgi:dTDP-4-dehydrorhamnose reductase